MDKFEKFLKNIPVMPDVATKVLSFAEDLDEVSFNELESLISMDPGLTAKILKVANSALYARQQQISRLQTAISLLGFKAIKSLVMLLTASNMFSKKPVSPFYKYFWQHSLITAFIAQKLCDMTGSTRIREEAFLAGLLHDIGQMSLYESQMNAYDTIMAFINVNEEKTSSEETEIFGVNHREVGRRIMESWNFPSMFADTAGEHGNVNIQSPHKELIVIVSIADLMTTILHEFGFTDEM
ncbi:HDOD domain-containing protein [Oceanispirochaeta sp.]|jgi:putative nucleotidyltransferase with HDIG domain|uniref:HDOD domain-containing protein n=1 Tax=Oceanispirochaeta sp. TaxID=2035350 RepID=UPI00262693FA|nr:HDOD domain-containing protein [Oceanispirochaeta sp.]MDA3955440.1 HDOD domain-containing protein [Oceanispirochaeta sp.]